LRVKLRYLDGWNASRRAHAARYRELLPPDLRIVEERPESPCIYHLFPTRLDNRDQVLAQLRKQGIETGIHYCPAVHRHYAWSHAPLRHGELPVAEAWAAEELSLPMHPDLESDEIERVAEAIAVVGGAER
jgi:dTDP-4-amino-4,6-dideoxygalactose transaminase